MTREGGMSVYGDVEAMKAERVGDQNTEGQALQIPLFVAGIETSLEDLTKTLLELRSRLTPVLQEVVTDSADEKAIHVGKSPLASQLEAIDIRIKDLGISVQSVLLELQI